MTIHKKNPVAMSAIIGATVLGAMSAPLAMAQTTEPMPESATGSGTPATSAAPTKKQDNRSQNAATTNLNAQAKAAAMAAVASVPSSNAAAQGMTPEAQQGSQPATTSTDVPAPSDSNMPVDPNTPPATTPLPQNQTTDPAPDQTMEPAPTPQAKPEGTM